jgi:drug/metabolite transporter (DMT)-like permease
MTLSPTARRRMLFVVLCAIWGTTWLALKAGATVVPPALFSGTRWLTAGLLLLGWRWAWGESLRIRRPVRGRLLIVALLMVTVNQSLMLYGLHHVGSGLAAVINAALTPIALLGLSLASGQESFSLRQALAIALGVCGILILFGPAAMSGELDLGELLGAALVIGGCLSYSAGSVLARPLMRTMPPVQLAATTNVIGGGILLAGALLIEPGVGTALSGHWGTAAWLAWWYLLLPGSLGGTIIYLLLIRDWGATRAGTYAFVSPVIAVILGLVVYAERLRPSDAIGMVLMLLAAGLALAGSATQSRSPVAAEPKLRFTERSCSR